ncbi:DUF669 domain-containing protein [Rhizobium sp. RCAM05973]|uniref:DUF669 domain-containing protein n=1 Tax=Rhizobium sp. RCAM05973 TaxID=2994066 RepID=UPI0022EC0E03|nr:DUF669 domain-containing protein [Rhizobium sp. RCAM05973]
MAQLGQRFDATQHDTEQRDFEDLPNGIYQVEIEASDVAKTSNGKGTILKTTNVVIAPEEYKGRKLFNNFNLENANSLTQEIGQKQFAALCRAIGVDTVDDSEELHFHSYTVKVGLGKPSKDGQYPARAEIKRYYFPDEGNVPDPEIDANQPARPPAPANDNKPAQRSAPAQQPAKAAGSRPWGRK